MKKPLIKILILAVAAVLITCVIVAYANYSAVSYTIFRQTVASRGYEIPSIEYSGQTKLYSCNREGTDWGDEFIPKEYKSKRATDVGGAVIVEHSFANLAKYGEAGNNRTDARVVYEYDEEYYSLAILDPFKGKIIAEKTFSGKAKDEKLPEKASSNHTYYVNKSIITDWVGETWSEYLKERGQNNADDN